MDGRRRAWLPRVAVAGWLLAAGPAAGLGQAGAPDPGAERAFSRAMQLERGGRLAEAREALREVLRADPDHVGALAAILRVATAMGEPGAALGPVERALDEGRASDPAIRQLWVRALSAAGRADSALAVVRRWTDSAPDDLAGWTELASELRRRGEPAAAIAALRTARERGGDAELFAQELAELHLQAGDPAAAAGEWVTVLRWGDPGVSAVALALEGAGAARDPAVAELWARLLEPSTPAGAARAGVRLAFALGERERAHALVAGVASRLPPDARLPFLREVALEARERGWARLAGWTAGRLAREVEDAGERRRWRALAAEATLEEGDTSAARAALEAVAREAAPGTDSHRTATRHLIVLQADADPERAERLLGGFARAYADQDGGRDAARLAVELARVFVRRGDLDGAARVLDAVGGAATDAAAAAALEGERGRLALYRGRPGAALEALRTAAFVPSGRPEERTEAIALVDALSAADSAEAVPLGRLLLDLARGEPGPAGRLLEAWSRTPETRARPALLAVAAVEADRAGVPAEAVALRSVLVERYPDAPEVAGALLELARHAAPERPEEARRWLEKLILEHPSGALTPVARRLLGELSGRVPSS